MYSENVPLIHVWNLGISTSLVDMRQLDIVAGAQTIFTNHIYKPYFQTVFINRTYKQCLLCTCKSRYSKFGVTGFLVR